MLTFARRASQERKGHWLARVLFRILLGNVS